MNIQKTNAVNFGKLYYQNLNKNFLVTRCQKNTWSIVKDRLDPYVSNIVPSLEKQADMDVVLLYNDNGTSTLKLTDKYYKFENNSEADSHKCGIPGCDNPEWEHFECDKPELIENMRSPKIEIKFTNKDQKTWDGVTKKLNTFIALCENYLKTCDPEYSKVKIIRNNN